MVFGCFISPNYKKYYNPNGNYLLSIFGLLHLYCIILPLNTKLTEEVEKSMRGYDYFHFPGPMISILP
jgi:hypothetical protein